MDEKQDTVSKKRKLKKFRILIIILSLFLLSGIFLHFRSGRSNDLQLKIDELHAKGYPVTLEELDQLYSIPDNEENAADYIMDAISNYNEPNDSSVLDIANELYIEPLPKDIIKSATKYLNDNQKSLELLHNAGTLKYCRYPVNFSISKAPNIFNIQKMVKLLCVEGAVHAENGDNETTINSLICSFNIADSLGDIPLMMCQLGRIVFIGLNVQALEHNINMIDFTDEQLARLSKIIAEKQRLSSVSYGFTGTLCISADELVKFHTKNLSSSGMTLSERLLIPIYRSVGFFRSEGIIYLGIIGKFVEAGKLPLEKRLEGISEIKKEIDNISGIHKKLKNAFNIQSYKQIFSDELMIISKLRAAQAALAVQRYRLKNEKLPELLSELVPEFLDEVPIDPFDGKGLRYKKLDTGFVVYSIGEDLIDNIGQEDPNNSIQRDITFTIKK